MLRQWPARHNPGDDAGRPLFQTLVVSGANFERFGTSRRLLQLY